MIKTADEKDIKLECNTNGMIKDVKFNDLLFPHITRKAHTKTVNRYDRLNGICAKAKTDGITGENTLI